MTESRAMGEGSATEIDFYQLEQRTLDDVLPALLEMSLKRGWRAAVQATSEERVAALDTRLWTYREESFLPHGTAGDGRASAQPIYLTADDDNPNAAHVRFLVDGATLAYVSPYIRVAHVFDGRDQETVARAREAWREAKARGNAVRYFQQDGNGRWLEQA